MKNTKIAKEKDNTPPRGGKREGAGRPVGSGKYGEPTRAIRIPQSLVGSVFELLSDYEQGNKPSHPMLALKAAIAQDNKFALPLYDHKVAAGFPSPADAHTDTQLDLNQYLIKNPTTTFYVRVEGESMLNAGIHPNDLLVVDLSLSAQEGNVVIAMMDGEFTVKRLKYGPQNQIWLMPENEKYPPLLVKEGMDFRIWGVVTNVIHAL